MSLPAVFESKVVQYGCTCGERVPLTRLYFCRHCVSSRCRRCASHEVDSQFCSHCLEYIPTIDGKLKKNRCSVCYSCPVCGLTLTTRACVDSGHKSYYLLCLSCRWTTRDSRITDSSSASHSWPEPEHGAEQRIRDLYAHAGHVAQQEKRAQKEKWMRGSSAVQRQAPSTRHAVTLLSKYGISLSPRVTQSLRQNAVSSVTSSASRSDTQSSVEPAIPHSVTEPDVDYGHLYSQLVDLESVPGVSERLRGLQSQPSVREDLRPVAQMLAVRRSLRCRVCDHNLCKPECNPSSIKFKILLSAYYHVPDVRLVSYDQDFILLTVCNPTPYPLTLSSDSHSVPSLTLPAKDPTAGISDLSSVGQTDSEPKMEFPDCVVRVQGHKVTLRLPLLPEKLIPDEATGSQSMTLSLTHDFVKSLVLVPGSEKRQPQIQSVSHTVFVNGLNVTGIKTEEADRT